jgi:hypothetical protein
MSLILSPVEKSKDKRKFESILDSGGVAPFILNLCIRYRRVVGFTLRPLCRRGTGPRYPVFRRMGDPQKDGLDSLINIKTSCFCREPNHCSSDFRHLSQSLYKWRYTSSYVKGLKIVHSLTENTDFTRTLFAVKNVIRFYGTNVNVRNFIHAYQVCTTVSAPIFTKLSVNP